MASVMKLGEGGEIELRVLRYERPEVTEGPDANCSRPKSPPRSTDSGHTSERRLTAVILRPSPMSWLRPSQALENRLFSRPMRSRSGSV